MLYEAIQKHFTIFKSVLSIVILQGDGRLKVPSSLHPEDGGSKFLRNVGVLQQHYTASQPRRPQLELLLG
jgi:hypothetical protein